MSNSRELQPGDSVVTHQEPLADVYVVKEIDGFVATVCYINDGGRVCCFAIDKSLLHKVG